MTAAEDEPRAWRFESSVFNPSGLCVTVVVSVPENVYPMPAGEIGEHTQITANQALDRITKAIRIEQDKVPF